MLQRDLAIAVAAAAILCACAMGAMAQTAPRLPATTRMPPAGAATRPPPAGAALNRPRAAGTPQAQAANRGDTESIGDWTVRCVTVKAVVPCEMFQASMNKKTKQLVTHVSFAYVMAQDDYATQIVVPLGVSLAKGVTLSAGAQHVDGIKFHRCERNGCYVEAELNKGYIEGLSAGGASGVIRVVPYRANKPVDFPLSLKGFAPALAKMKELARQKAAPQAAAPAPAAAAPSPTQ